jgi:hypothetical protein
LRLVRLLENGLGLECSLIAPNLVRRLSLTTCDVALTTRLPNFRAMLDSRSYNTAQMPPETHFPEVLRFGTFEVDLHTGELRKHGKRDRNSWYCVLDEAGTIQLV